MRRPDELRPVRITRGYTEMTPGSVLMVCPSGLTVAGPAFRQRWVALPGVGPSS